MPPYPLSVSAISVIPRRLNKQFLSFQSISPNVPSYSSSCVPIPLLASRCTRERGDVVNMFILPHEASSRGTKFLLQEHFACPPTASHSILSPQSVALLHWVFTPRPVCNKSICICKLDRSCSYSYSLHEDIHKFQPTHHRHAYTLASM